MLLGIRVWEGIDIKGETRLWKTTINDSIGSLRNIATEKTSYLQVVTSSLFNFDYSSKRSFFANAIPFMGHVEQQYARVHKDQEVAVPTIATGKNVTTKNPQYYEPIHQDEIIMQEKLEDVSKNPENFTKEQMQDLDFLIKNVYSGDDTIDFSEEDFNIDYYLNKDLSVDLSGKGPKVLIFHTHSQEDFIDSRPGIEADTVVGVGDELKKILEQKYGVEVIHDKTKYDFTNGKVDRNKCYYKVDQNIPRILKKYPTIEVVIDIHRDGIPSSYHLVTDINGKSTARVMFVNGLSKLKVGGKMVPIKSLPNENLKDNMALSFRMHMKANELYGNASPDLTRKIYLKAYRYSTHMKPKSLLIEVGAQTNTVREAKNAMEPVAKTLYEVISGK